mgnify:CR=1 FL=1
MNHSIHWAFVPAWVGLTAASLAVTRWRPLYHVLVLTLAVWTFDLGLLWSSPSPINRNLQAPSFHISALAGLALAACGSDDATDTTTVSEGTGASTEESTGATTGESASGECTVGVSWNNFQEERWAKWDEPAIKAAVEAGGGKYISNDAKSSAETQASNVENLITQGANVVVILAQDGTAIKPSVANAIANGVPVIAYDRLIEDAGALYITFDNVEVGRLEAEEIFKQVPEGNYIIIKGNKADANADFLREGYEKVIGEAVKAGDIIAEPLDTFEPGLDAAARKKRVQEMMDKVGLLPLMINRYPHELSGGMQQRVALVRALALGAPLLAMDEPLAALDEITRSEMRGLLNQLVEGRGVTTLFVTHSISEAVALSEDRKSVV